MGAIKTIAVDESGDILATGGVDEYIKIYNLKTRKEKGELTQHSGSITALKFFKSSHLLSASSDGTLCIWQTRDWVCVHIMGGHKGAVTCISIHPSGRMALTGSVDRSIRLWNLVEGRCAFISKPNYSKTSVIELIEWSQSGTSYAVVSGGNLYLYNASQVCGSYMYVQSESVTGL
jgi:protein MAK11